MPRAEETVLETLQSYGLIEEEPPLSGCKRICYLGGWIEGMAEKWCWLIILIIKHNIMKIKLRR